MAAVKCRRTRRCLPAWAAGATLVGALLLGPSAAGAGTTSSTSSSTSTTVAAPSQAQISATQAQVNSIVQTIAHEQQRSEVLSQEYDAATQQLQDDEAALATTESNLANTQATLSTDRSHLRLAAINAYVYGQPASAVTTLFSGSADQSDAQRVYAQTVVGDVAGAAAAVRSQEGRLASQQADQRSEESKARAAATEASSLETQNQNEVTQTEYTLSAVKGTLANEVAEAAEAQAAQAAAAAAKASNSQQAQQDAQAAAGDSSAAAAAGGSGNNSGGGSTGPAPPPVVPTVPVSGDGSSTSAGTIAAQAAVTQIGVPYQFGGETPGVGFDCSGLAQWAWAQAGVAIPRTTEAQWAALPHVSLSALEPGDLLYYFNLDGDNAVDHVVMYLGAGPYGADTIIQAPYTGTTVSYAPIFTEGLIGAARP